MRILVAVFLTSTLLLSAPKPICAGWPDYGPSYVATVSGGIYMTPAGTGPSLDEQGLTLEILAEEFNHGVLAGLPREDIWIECAQQLELQFCGQGNIADVDTDAQGRTRFALPLRGGSYCETGVLVFIQGAFIGVGEPFSDQFVVSLAINSPDINGDLVVDLSDIALFSQDLDRGDAFRSDFNHDGVVNLSDIAIFAGALGDRCP